MNTRPMIADTKTKVNPIMDSKGMIKPSFKFVKSAPIGVNNGNRMKTFRVKRKILA